MEPTDRRLHPADRPLTERELEVLRLMEEGFTQKEAARILRVSLGTVETHLEHIYRKLEVNSSAQATHYAREHGWIALDGIDRHTPLPE